MAVTALAVALRLFFIWKFRLVDGDTLVYGDIAKNWLRHGVFGVTTASGPLPTYIRLPGYPAFLAAIWAIVGIEHYNAVLIVQLLADVATCFVVADLARRVASERAAKVAFVLAAVCPFLATYVATPLTETLAIFFAALALDAVAAGLDGLAAGRMRAWVVCGVAVAASILLRPDGGILLPAIGLYLGFLLVTQKPSLRPRIVAAGLIVASVAFAPLVPWTIRNWHDFHRFQPLAPRYANAPGEPVNWGFQRWTKTWMLDFVSVSEIYWNMPDTQIDTSLLPSRAFDSAAERQRTEQIFASYNDQGKWTKQMDDALGEIARERIARHPLRYYVWLPAGRIADIWLRPRAETLGVNDRWWEFSDDPSGAFWASLLGVINLLYIGLAIYGLIRFRSFRFLGALILFVVLRSLFLGTLENPEPRYALECYPVVFVLAGAAFAKVARKTASVTHRRVAHAEIVSEMLGE